MSRNQSAKTALRSEALNKDTDARIRKFIQDNDLFDQKEYSVPSQVRKVEEGIKRGADYLATLTPKGKHKEEIKAVTDFLKAISDYTKNPLFGGEHHKIRVKLMNSWNALPQVLKDAWSIPSVTPEYLVRGARKITPIEANGDSIGSFTSKLATAESFLKFFGNSEDKGRLYNLSDIESYKHLINVDAVEHTMQQAVETTLENKKVDSLEQLRFSDWASKDRPGNGGEYEHILVGIKWKPEVDTPAWKAEAQDRSDKYRSELALLGKKIAKHLMDNQ